MTSKRESSLELRKLNLNYNTSRASRFYTAKSDDTPGPGQYSPKPSPTNSINFAVSRRSPLFPTTDNPPPGSYHLSSCFDTKKSYTFSPKLSKSVPRYPGPGSYNLKDTSLTAARAVFGKEKRRDNFLKTELLGIPGPGKYNFSDKSLIGPRWKFGSAASRKEFIIEENPGPGSYEISAPEVKTAFKFPSGRKPMFIPKIPGPGHYNLSQSPLNQSSLKFASNLTSQYFSSNFSLRPTPSNHSKPIGSMSSVNSSDQISK